MRKHVNMSRRTESDQPVYMEHLLTVDDVCTILQLSRVKIYDLMRREGLPTVKINGARRIQPTKLQAWIEQHGA